MTINKEIHVNIGEVKIATGDEILMASLGSCVGIAFLWKKKNLYGLAHCLLPESQSPMMNITGRFVNQAVPSLVALMNIEKKDRREIDVVIAGGGNMTAPIDADPNTLVGFLNVQAAEKYLKEYGFQIVQRDLGGESSRRIRVLCGTGEVSIQTIPRM